MIRRLILIPKSARHSGRHLIRDRGQVADLLGAALRRQGVNPHDGTDPARWGFGVVARRIRTQGPRLYAIDAIHLGSSDPAIADAMARIEAPDLVLDDATPGWELDLRGAQVHNYSQIPDGLEAINLYCVSPIRLTRRLADGSQEDVIALAPDLNALINRTMERRFGRPFRLQLLPDRLYLRGRSSISAGFAIKSDDRGRAIVKRGIALPFTLAGPFEDLQHAWYAGLGRTTGLGFGMLEMAS
ncbi:CRISPR-associated endoribonuclease Cas6 [Thiocystis violacea]|uniref:CRISPR-associated endoribonuclease Cas6 n=1 Tax=Thiocystis violacea TaxID=13725 RepID=UPI001905F00E|nr:CRISPR-associated endoribonuclease Cas6 [Thiocystis violacea]MBK1717852.1 hypothetical protein [Thiocystis violacea]